MTEVARTTDKTVSNPQSHSSTMAGVDFENFGEIANKLSAATQKAAEAFLPAFDNVVNGISDYVASWPNNSAGIMHGDNPGGDRKVIPGAGDTLTSPHVKTGEGSLSEPKIVLDTGDSGGIVKTGGEKTLTGSTHGPKALPGFDLEGALPVKTGPNPNPGPTCDPGAYEIPAPVRNPLGDSGPKPNLGDTTGDITPAPDHESDVKAKPIDAERVRQWLGSVGDAIEQMASGYAPHRPAEGGLKGEISKPANTEIENKGRTPTGEKIDRFNEALEQLPDGALKDFMQEGFDMATTGKIDEARLVSMAQKAMEEYGKLNSRTKERLDALNKQLERDFGLHFNVSGDSVNITNSTIASESTTISVSKEGKVAAFQAKGSPEITELRDLNPADAAKELNNTARQVAEGRIQFRQPAPRRDFNPPATEAKPVSKPGKLYSSEAVDEVYRKAAEREKDVVIKYGRSQ